MTSFDTLLVTAGDTTQPLTIRKELVAVGKATPGQPVQIHASPTMRRDPYAYGCWLASTGDGSCLVLHDGYYGIDDMIACLRGYLSIPTRNPAQHAAATQLLTELERI